MRNLIVDPLSSIWSSRDYINLRLSKDVCLVHVTGFLLWVKSTLSVKGNFYFYFIFKTETAGHGIA